MRTVLPALAQAIVMNSEGVAENLKEDIQVCLVWVSVLRYLIYGINFCNFCSIRYPAFVDEPHVQYSSFA